MSWITFALARIKKRLVALWAILAAHCASSSVKPNGGKRNDSHLLNGFWDEVKRWDLGFLEIDDQVDSTYTRLQANLLLTFLDISNQNGHLSNSAI